MLENFKKYLVGPDNLREEDSASRTVSDVRRFFLLVESSEDVSKIFNIESVSENYIAKLQVKQLKAGSIKKYLFSLSDFCTFLILDKSALVISGCQAADLSDMKLKLHTWRKTYNRADCRNFWLRQERDHESLVTPTQVSVYFDSLNAKEARKLFEFSNKSTACNSS